MLLCSYRLLNLSTGEYITIADYIKAMSPNCTGFSDRQKYNPQVWYSSPPSTSDLVLISKVIMTPVSALEISKLSSGYTFDPEN
jgi:hypothetical protein